MIPPLGSVASASGAQISQATAMTVSTVYACVDRLSTDLARCTPFLYWLDKEETRHKVVSTLCSACSPGPIASRPGSSLRASFGFPSPSRQWLCCHPPRCPWEPIELIPINPDAVMVLEAGDGSIFYNVNRIGLWQIAMLRDFPVAIPADDMFHLRACPSTPLSASPPSGWREIRLAWQWRWSSRPTAGLPMGRGQRHGSRRAHADRACGQATEGPV
jgi:hypothetical protein